MQAIPTPPDPAAKQPTVVPPQEGGGFPVLTGQAPQPVQPKARLTVTETVYHQLDGAPTAAESRFARWLGSDEQPYVRHLKLSGTKLTRLDKGWLEATSYVVVENRGPLPAELGVFDSAAFSIVPPGESVRLVPLNVTLMWACCPGGETKVVVHVFPG